MRAFPASMREKHRSMLKSALIGKARARSIDLSPLDEQLPIYPPGTAWRRREPMRIQTFGRSGLRVSDLFLGTMTFGESWGWGAPLEECRKILETYLEAGGNVIDTDN